MYPIVNPYRDKERLANAEGSFVGKSKKGTPHWSSRSLLTLVLLVITCVMYYMHHVHNAHLLVNDKPSIRGSVGSFSQSVKESSGIGSEMGETALPVDLRKKDDPSVVRKGKINSFNPRSNDNNAPVGAPYSPELLHKLQAQSLDAGAIEDKVIALAALARKNEQKATLERAEKEQEEAREAQRVAEEAALAAEREHNMKLIADRRAAQVAADIERKAQADRRAAQIEAERLAAQLEQDALLAKRADEQRQAAVLAQEEETLRAAEAAAAAAIHEQEGQSQPVGVLAPPLEPEPLKVDPSVPSEPQPAHDGPIGVLAPPVEPEPAAQNPPVAPGDVIPVGNVDPVEPDHTVEDAANLVAAAMAAEMNLGHPNVPPEEEHHELPPPDHPVVLTPPEAQQHVPNLAVEGAPVLDHPVVMPRPPDQAVIPAEPAIPQPVQPVPLVPPQGLDTNVASENSNEPTPPERPMGFDLPPDKILKMAAVPVVEVATGEKVDYCAGNVDPFAAQSVERFQPPANADFELATQWSSAVAAMTKRISKVTFGGEQLRELIRGEVETLKVLRFKMFCKFA